MWLERVLQMSVDEVVIRGRQEASKWLDRMAAVKAETAFLEGAKPRAGGVREWAPGDHSRLAPVLLDHFQERVQLCFFEGAAHAEAMAQHFKRIPECRERIISAADAICQGRFDLLGYHGLNFGDPVDWHLDPISGRRAPRVHWSRLDPLDPGVVGDSKVVWELNRHQWLLHLGQAYRLTREERYAEAFARYVREWMRANPAGIGINWASSLEVAFRLISWCWALVLFDGSRALSADLCAQMLAGIEVHARHVERYLSYYFAPNTHLTGEALGLFYAGVLFPDPAPAHRWRSLGARILVEQCERQILADGVYFEQSTYYTRYTAEIYLHFLILAARSDTGVPDTVARRLQRLLDFLMAVRRPDRSMLQIGDDDGGWLLPLLPRAPDDLRGVFSAAAAFFGRSDYAWAAEGLAPEILWLLGPTGVKEFDALTPAPPQTMPSRLFPDGGYVVMQTGRERDAHQLVFDVGPLGSPFGAGHGHADLLSIQCSIFGQPYLIDAGTYGYTAEPAWRNFFRGTAAHSTIMVDGVEQAVPSSPFKWQTQPRSRVRRSQSNATTDFVDASHDAYCRLPDPVVHRRRVLFVKPRYWIVVDDLGGAAEHQVELRFQFAPMAVTVDPDLWARARGGGGHGLLIRPFAAVGLKAEILEGEVAPIRGWVSRNYGRRQPGPVVIYSAMAALPLRIVTLLYPIQNCLASPPTVSPLACDGLGPVGVILESEKERICFDDDAFIISSVRGPREKD
jgi:Heparinase II/III-like protein/Heparinase II/III N-terminus